MKELVNKENLKTLSETIIYFTLGVLFCILLETMLDFVESVACFILLGIGVICLIIYVVLPSDSKIPSIAFYSAIGAGLGIFILIWPKFFVIALSVLIALNGVGLIFSAVKDKKKNIASWKINLIFGIIFVIFGIVLGIFSGTSIAKKVLSIYIGVTLLIESGFGLYKLILIKKNSSVQNNTKTDEKVKKENSEKNRK